ncbi:MAG TPA: 50S ribosomal protein L22 [Verrucomicrobia bacterium]|nr:MAG: 50S ribosomal protein L22 [Lentisphaerae bacterium GWF2_57_35]HBA83555.1 50S ribosomal protein L22 [Verrucomicrobiota bacterium]
MEIQAKTTFVRMAPSKARDLARAMRGLPVGEALKLVEFNERKAAFYIGKTLKSAIANAENNAKLSADTLFVSKAVIEKGPVMKRFWPRARGMASPIEKKMSHIKITLTDKKPAAK